MPQFRPIYLFADSQILFWRPFDALFISSLRKLLSAESPKAAYIGASNDDNPEYYGIFEAAMDSIGLRDRRMIAAELSPDDASFVEQSDLILLAGGDVKRGWRTFEQNGLKDLIITAYSKGVLLIGISAGAAQLGMLGRSEADSQCKDLFNTFRLVPFVIGAHEEDSDWATLKRMLQVSGINVSGIGIPAGGGMIYHADHSIEAIRYPLHEFSVASGQIKHDLILARGGQNVIEATEVC